ncbi:MAG: aminotransferase class V-fold PLP-dependent enzyme, partial [Flavobacteriales bacterium]
MRVYLDNAATTPIAPEVTEAMIKVLQHHFGNPSSSHAFGREAKALLETSRRNIAKHLNCLPSELFFTSGGTEADNLACYIAVQELGVKRIISTSIEHHAVGHTVEMYRDRFKVELHNLNLDAQGHIDLSELEALLKEPIPTLVSL